jgi:hypothetical protein
MSLLTNLISYWKLDGDATDATATHNDGTPTDITFNSGNGKINQGAGFNGTTSKIALGTAITIPTNLTLSAWIKNNNTGLQNIFCDGDNVGGSVFWQFIANGKKIQFGWWAVAGRRIWETTNDVIPDTGWHFVTVTQIGTADPIIYVDGSPVTSSLTYSYLLDTKPTAQGSVFGGGYFFNGAIDEVGIWSRALTSTEGTQLWNGGAGLAYPFSTNQRNMFLLF